MPESLTLASVCSIALQELDTSFLQVRLSLATIVFPKPHRFNPQCWIDDAGRMRNDLWFFMFGFGRRTLHSFTHSTPTIWMLRRCQLCRTLAALATISSCCLPLSLYPSLLSPPSLAAARHYPLLLLAVIPTSPQPMLMITPHYHNRSLDTSITHGNWGEQPCY
ncbi:hypothetical protein C8R48DRAFT_779417 [Suillus tomentosus]|nr:hypothetical protein C8R48DRAFT_779417 [Suillus tomentosus]